MAYGLRLLPTVISQFLSAILCMYQLMRGNGVFRLVLKEILRPDGRMLRQIVVNGVPCGRARTPLISVRQMFLYRPISIPLGATAVAGCGSYSKIEGFGFLPVTCFALALTTFISQNLGGPGNTNGRKRARCSARSCSLTMAEVVGLLINFFSPVLMRAFGGGEEAIQYGRCLGRDIHLVLLPAGPSPTAWRES